MTLAMVVRAPGTNCDAEVSHGLELAGARARLVHVDGLIASPGMLEEAEIVAFPGGFSYGDDVASGRIFAMKVRERLYPSLREAAGRGCLMIGICNGFQVMVQAGLLPGVMDGEAGAWPEEPPRQVLALTDNAGARYECRWVGVRYEPRSVCVWTRGLADLARNEEERGAYEVLPVGHGEGRLVAESAGVMEALERRGQVAVRYAENFNGSEGSVAGVCDATGRVFGLMPHPDRFLSWTRHPAWTRLSARVREGEAPGARMFRNAVEAAREGVGAR